MCCKGLTITIAVTFSVLMTVAMYNALGVLSMFGEFFGILVVMPFCNVDALSRTALCRGLVHTSGVQPEDSPAVQVLCNSFAGSFFSICHNSNEKSTETGFESLQTHYKGFDTLTDTTSEIKSLSSELRSVIFTAEELQSRRLVVGGGISAASEAVVKSGQRSSSKLHIYSASVSTGVSTIVDLALHATQLLRTIENRNLLKQITCQFIQCAPSDEDALEAYEASLDSFRFFVFQVFQLSGEADSALQSLENDLLFLQETISLEWNTKQIQAGEGHFFNWFLWILLPENVYHPLRILKALGDAIAQIRHMRHIVGEVREQLEVMRRGFDGLQNLDRLRSITALGLTERKQAMLRLSEGCLALKARLPKLLVADFQKA